MKQYPSMSQEIRNVPAYVFDKLDGSNIRAEWCPKKGFWKFGSKTRLLGTDQLWINAADQLIRQKYEDELSKVFRKERYEKAVAFFEFYGENSFAGSHKEEEHKVILFDVSWHKRGFIPPDEFLKLFGHLDIPKLLYRGNINQPFVESVRKSELPGITFEGVVCKAKMGREVLMFKIKTLKWLERLKGFCQGDQLLFDRLK
jgi:hypothetical protein